MAKKLQQLDTPMAKAERDLIALGYVFNRNLAAWVHRDETPPSRQKWMVDLYGARDGYAKVTERDKHGVPVQRGTLTAHLIAYDKLNAFLQPEAQAPAA